MAKRGITLTKEGLIKVQQKMAVLPRPLDLEKFGWTQEDLVVRSGISLSTVKRVLKGEPKDRNTIISIANALNLDPSTLVDPSDWNRESVGKSSISFEQWRQICEKVLEEKRQPNINELLRSQGAKRDVDDLFIPLGLVEKKQTRVKWDSIGFGSVEQGSGFYEPQPEEIVRRFDQANEFFETVIRGERSAQSRPMIIIGEPGAGKTTLLQKIATELPDELLPVWVSLADLRGYDLDQYLFGGTWWNQADKTLPPETGEEFRELFKTGRVCLLLDGVDEMSVPSEQRGRSQLRVIYDQVKGWSDRIQVIMTCRVNVWEADPLFYKFEMYRNLQLEYPEQVEQYIDNFFSKPDLTVQSGEVLKQELRENDRVQDTVKNPLRLALLCHAFQCGGKLPDTQAGLYEMFLKSFYDIKKEQFYVEPAEREALHQALGELALEALDRDQSNYRIDRSTAEKILGHPEQKNPKSFFYQALELGLLNQIGYVVAENSFQECYAFIHPTFQDYHASILITRKNFLFEQISIEYPSYKRIFNSIWHDTFSFWINNQNTQPSIRNEVALEILNLQDGCGGFYICKAQLIIASNIDLFSQDLQEIILNLLFKWSFKTLISEGTHFSLQFYEIGNNFLRNSAKDILRKINPKILTPFLYEKFSIYENIWSVFFDDFTEYTANTVDTKTFRIINEYAREMRISILYLIGKNNKYEIDHCLHRLNEEMKIALQEYENKHTFCLLMMLAGKIIDLDFNFYINYVSHHLIKILSYVPDFPINKEFLRPQNSEESELLNKVLVRFNYSYFNSINGCFYDILSSDYRDSSRFDYLVLLHLQNILADDGENNLITINRIHEDSYLPSPDFLISCQDKDALAVSLCLIWLNNKKENEILLLSLIEPLVYLALESKDKDIQLHSAYILRMLLVNLKFLKEVVKILNFYRNQDDSKFPNLDISFVIRESLLGYCSYHMSYQDFYTAWNSSNEIEKKQSGSTPQTQKLDRQFFNLQNQLTPTDTTYPLCLNLSSLQNLNDSAAMCQKFATISYQTIDSNFEDLQIPENIQNPAQLETKLLHLRKYLKTKNPNLKNLALILHDSDPTPELLQILNVLQSSFSIAWITDRPHPYRSFLPTAENLPKLIQTWLTDLN